MSVLSSKLLDVEKKSKKKNYYKPSTNVNSRNPIFLKLVNVGCPYCYINKTGRKKNFKSLYRLNYHFLDQHENEPRYKELITNLATLILKGVLL